MGRGVIGSTTDSGSVGWGSSPCALAFFSLCVSAPVGSVEELTGCCPAILVAFVLKIPTPENLFLQRFDGKWAFVLRD